MSKLPEGDQKLLGYIEEAQPSTFDEALNLYAELAEAQRPYLTGIAAKAAWLDTQPDDVVSETILKGFLTLYLQLGGTADSLPEDMAEKASVSFVFERKHNITLRTWLVQLMKGGGGVLRTHNRRAKTSAQRCGTMPEHETVDFADQNNSGIEATIDALKTGDQYDQLEAAVKKLPPRQQFILTVRYGLSGDDLVSAERLSALAKDAGMENARKVSARAKRSGLSPGATKLQMQQIAQVLDLSTKQVKRDLVDAISALNILLTQDEAA